MGQKRVSCLRTPHRRNLTNTPALASRGNCQGKLPEGEIMGTKAAPTIGASRPRLAGDILWLGFTGLVLALILGIMCWPLSAELSLRNTASAAPHEPTATLASRVGASSAATAPLPALAAGTSITQLSTLMTPPDDNSEGARSLATAEPGRANLAPLSLGSPSAQSAHPASAAHRSAAPRSRPHHPRIRPLALGKDAQLTPPCGSSLPPC
jgi:hypothetical protein